MHVGFFYKNILIKNFSTIITQAISSKHQLWHYITFLCVLYVTKKLLLVYFVITRVMVMNRIKRTFVPFHSYLSTWQRWYGWKDSILWSLHQRCLESICFIAFCFVMFTEVATAVDIGWGDTTPPVNAALWVTWIKRIAIMAWSLLNVVLYSFYWD